MTPYSTLETLVVYTATVLAIGLYTYMVAKHAREVFSRSELRKRTTAEERREKLLKLISSTERERYR